MRPGRATAYAGRCVRHEVDLARERTARCGAARDGLAETLDARDRSGPPIGRVGPVRATPSDRPSARRCNDRGMAQPSRSSMTAPDMRARHWLTAAASCCRGAGGGGGADVGRVPDSPRRSRRGALLTLAVGWSFSGLGLVAWVRWPGSLTGPLMIAVGLAWFARAVGALDAIVGVRGRAPRRARCTWRFSASSSSPTPAGAWRAAARRSWWRPCTCAPCRRRSWPAGCFPAAGTAPTARTTS